MNTDEERLEWLIFNSAKVCHSKDGENCWVVFYEEDACLETGLYYDARDAIDGAMEGRLHNM